eukprot:SAG22_NODE_457_length_10262_cov_17.627964_4_plen_32_part_00
MPAHGVIEVQQTSVMAASWSSIESSGQDGER